MTFRWIMYRPFAFFTNLSVFIDARSLEYNATATPVPCTNLARYVPWAGECLDDYRMMLNGKPVYDEEFYAMHNSAIQRAIAPERLLTFNAREGWGPLCRFLGKPLPSFPYPHVNEAEGLARLEYGLAFIVITWPAWITLPAWLVARCVRRRCAGRRALGKTKVS